MIGLWLGALPFGVLVLSIRDRYLSPPGDVIVGLTYMGVFGVASAFYAFATCPNCGNAFSFGFPKRFRWQSPWAPRCVHCDARIGDPISKPDVRVH